MNRESLTQLKPAEKIASKPAYLQVAGQDRGFYAFNYNPEKISESLQAKYAEVLPATASMPFQDYLGGTAVTRTFSDLLMDTYSEGLSLRPLIDGIKALMVCPPGEFEPPTLEFHWGSDSFKPCKLIDFSYEIDLWLGGEPARGKASLTFISIPSDKTPAPSQKTGDNSVNLTDRQQQDGIALALVNLKTNLQRQTPTIRNAVRTGRYRVVANAQGQIQLMSDKGAVLASLGNYNGFTLGEN